MGLWSLDAASRWIAVGATPDATAVGQTAGEVLIATAHQVDRRSLPDLSRPGRVTSLKWPVQAPAAPIVSVDGSPAGELAVVTADDQSQDYALAPADGSVTVLTPAPTDSFTPLVAWLDDVRLLVLTTDDQQVSRLAVVNTSTHTMRPSQAVLGARTFGLSGDRQTFAVATEKAVYMGPVADIPAGTPPQPIVTLHDSQVVWALALDAGGSQVFMLSGAVAPDGTIDAIHELGYARRGSSWVQVLDVSVPFAEATGQVCLG